MLPKINFTQTQTYQYLADHLVEIADKHLRSHFAEDPERFKKFSVLFNDILVDYSKNRIHV